MTLSLTIPWAERPLLASAWRAAPWRRLAPLQRSRACPATRFRMLAAPGGLHTRIECQAKRLTSRMCSDGDPLYLEDVVELFLWPLPEREPPQYLEHEVSPRGHCLTLVVSAGKPAARWTPWGLAPADQPRQSVTIRRGGWDVDIVLPWLLFAGLGAAPPKPGDRWRGNVTRIDHGTGKPRWAAWSPPPVINFHHLPAMGELRFAPARRSSR